jgi:hypothetical protein
MPADVDQVLAVMGDDVGDADGCERGPRAQCDRLGPVTGATKLSPPEPTLGNEVLKLAAHEMHESVYAIIETETARSGLFAQYLPPDPGFVRLDSSVGGKLPAIGSVSDPLQPNLNDRSSEGRSIDSKMGSRSRVTSRTYFISVMCSR